MVNENLLAQVEELIREDVGSHPTMIDVARSVARLMVKHPLVFNQLHLSACMELASEGMLRDTKTSGASEASLPGGLALKGS